MESFFADLNSSWLWLIFGSLLLAAEVLLVPTGFLLCIGASACIIGGLGFFISGIPLIWELSLFALLSVSASYGWLLFLRKKRTSRNGDDADTLSSKQHQLQGHQGTLDSPMVNGKGRLRINDSSWPIEAEQDYPAGTKVEVTKVNGITLKVRAIKGGEAPCAE